MQLFIEFFKIWGKSPLPKSGVRFRVTLIVIGSHPDWTLNFVTGTLVMREACKYASGDGRANVPVFAIVLVQPPWPLLLGHRDDWTHKTFVRAWMQSRISAGFLFFIFLFICFLECTTATFTHPPIMSRICSHRCSDCLGTSGHASV